MKLFFETTQEEIDDAIQNVKDTDVTNTCLFSKVLTKELGIPIEVTWKRIKISSNSKLSKVKDCAEINKKILRDVMNFDRITDKYFSHQGIKLKPDTYEINIPESWEPYITKK